MSKILIVDVDSLFLSDIQSALLLSDAQNEYVLTSNLDQLSSTIHSESPDEIVVSARILSSIQDALSQTSIKTRSYAKTNQDILTSEQEGIPCFGIIKQSAALFDAIQNDSILKVQSSPSSSKSLSDETPSSSRSTSSPLNEEEDIVDAHDSHLRSSQEDKEAPQPSHYDAFMNGNKDFEETKELRRKESSKTSQDREKKSHRDWDERETDWNDSPSRDHDSYHASRSSRYSGDEADSRYSRRETHHDESHRGRERYRDEYEDDREYAHHDRRYGEGPSIGSSHYSESYRDTRDSDFVRNGREEMESHRNRARDQREESNRRYQDRVRDRANQEVERDLGYTQDPAQVITVYSAKGGVGKTTIACELATMLSLISHGRGTYKVCIVDYNIDFGDVCSTIDLNPKGVSMVHWASDIKTQLDNRVPPDEINYSTDEIQEVYLQQAQSGLYALMAPLATDDGYWISDNNGIILQIMLKNLIENGGFDFVVVDTGNNTRDASLIPLEYADDIIMVITQDINTVNCNLNMLRTLQVQEFDLDKISTVVNKAKPYKAVDVSVREVQESARNPYTGRPYPCLTVINDRDVVARANNRGEPLVFKSSDEFTKNIGEIVHKLVNPHYALTPPPKKSFFQKLFSK